MASASTNRRGGPSRRTMPAYARPTRASMTRMADRGEGLRSTEAGLSCPDRARCFTNMAPRTSLTPSTSNGMLGMYRHDRTGRTGKGRSYRSGQVGLQDGRAPSQILQSRIRQLARGIKDKHSNHQSMESSRESLSVATEYNEHKMAGHVISDPARAHGAAEILRVRTSKNGNIDSLNVLEMNESSRLVREERTSGSERGSSTSRQESTDSGSLAAVQPTPPTSPPPQRRARRSAVFQLPPDDQSELFMQFTGTGPRGPDVPSSSVDETAMKEIFYSSVQSKDTPGSCLSSTTRDEVQPLVVDYPSDLPARYHRSFPATCTPDPVSPLKLEFSLDSSPKNCADRRPSDTCSEKDEPSSSRFNMSVRSRSLVPTAAGLPLMNRRPSSSGPSQGRSTSVTNISRAYKARRRSVFGLGLAASQQGSYTENTTSSSSPPGPRQATVAEIFRRSRQSRQQRLSVYLQGLNQGKESAAERLKRVFKTVKIIIGICLALKSYVKNSESRQWSLVEMQLNLRADMEKTLAFDPVMFAKLRVTRGSEKLRGILSAKRTERTKEDIDVVLALLRKNKTFADYKRDTQIALAKVMEYLKYEPRRIILKEGHKASGFYILLSGTCLINQKDIDPRTNEPFVRTIYEIHSGDSFGDMELLSDCTRTVSVVCKDECEVLLVDKEDFDTIIRAPLERERGELIRFCNTQNVFEKLPTSKDFRGFRHAISAKKFKPGVVITSDIGESEYIYVIRSGKCRVISEIREIKKKHPTDKKKSRKLKRSWTVIEPLREDGKLIPDYELFRALRHNTFLSVTEKKPSGEDADTDSKLHPVIPETIFEEKDRLQTKPHHDAEPASTTFRQVSAAEPVASNEKQNRHVLSHTLSRLKSTYAEVAMLKKGDVFGLETLMANNQSNTRLSLLSEGAECIVISKKFFAAQATASAYFHRSTKKTIEYPSAKCTLDKIRQARAWSSYKDSVVRDVCSRRIPKTSDLSR